MSAALLIEIGWKSLLFAALLIALLQLLKRRSASERSVLAHAGLLALLVMPAATLVGPTLMVEMPQLTAGVSDIAVPSLPESLSPQAGSLPVKDGNAVAFAAPEDTPTLAAWLIWVGYILPAVLLLFTALLAVVRLQSLRQRAVVLVEPAWLSALARAQRRMGIKHGTALLGSCEVGSPVSWGVVWPVIILDEDAAADPAVAEPIIAHELAHVAHFDWAKLLLGRLATAFLWFNPLVWLLVRHCP